MDRAAELHRLLAGYLGHGAGNGPSRGDQKSLRAAIQINEPLARRGPVVMNTQEELKRAFQEYREGTFAKNQ
jgi:hypothetical protein